MTDSVQDTGDNDDLYEEVSALEQTMESEERQLRKEGSFLSGGNTPLEEDFVVQPEVPLDEELVLNPRPVKDGPEFLNWLRGNLHEFESPHAMLGGEANSPDQDRFAAAEVTVLITRLSTYESVSLSMSHSLVAQIVAEVPGTYSDFAYLPKPRDYNRLRDAGYPVAFGNNGKLAPHRFDIMAISHPVSMEQLNLVSILHDSGIPLFKEQRMEREDVPIILVGGANSGTTEPWHGVWKDSTGKEWSGFVDLVIYGEAEQSLKDLIEVVRQGKKAGFSKREIIKSLHGKVLGLYEPESIAVEYDGKGSISSIKRAPGYDYVEFPIRRSTVIDLDTVRTLERKVLPYTGDGASVDVAIAGSSGCIGGAGTGNCSFCLAEGTMVQTVNGNVPIQELTVGDQVNTLGGLVAISAVLDQGVKEVYEIRTELGQRLLATNDHQLMVNTTGPVYKRVDQIDPDFDRVWLKLGTSSGLNPFMPAPFSSGRISVEIAQMLGYFEIMGLISEDSISYKYYDTEQRALIISALEAFAVLSDFVEEPPTTYGLLTVNNPDVVELVANLGSHTPQIMDIIHAAKINVKQAFLKGVARSLGQDIDAGTVTLPFQPDKLWLSQALQLLLLDLKTYASNAIHPDGSSTLVFPGLTGIEPVIPSQMEIRIESVRYVGFVHTWDITVPTQEHFVANGILVHNCREGHEGPYRERSLPQVMKALDSATRHQGTKEVSFFSLNFNQYSDLFPLVYESVKRGYQTGLISQRVDMLAETPEQIQMQRWLKKSNFTLGVEGCSQRMRNFLNKNLQEWEILKVCEEMMLQGAGELKLFMILTGMETGVDIDECCMLMEKINIMKERHGAKTLFRLSFTPLFPSAFTPLQFHPAMSALNHGSRSLDRLFLRAKELGWGRRLSVSGEEPLISNTINHGGRNITELLLRSHFQDGWRFYGNVPKGTWARWKPRVDADPNIDLDILWGQKSYEYIFPWEMFFYSTSKEKLWGAYAKNVSFQNTPYCLTTRTVKGHCTVNSCSGCDPLKTGKPEQKIIKMVVGRKVAPVIQIKDIQTAAKSREKAFHLRVKFATKDPIYRFVAKNYFLSIIPRAMMIASDEFNDAFVGPIGHARIAAGAAMARDWTYGVNIYDFSLSSHLSESSLRDLAQKVAPMYREGQLLDLRMETHLTALRTDIDYAVYSMLIPASDVSYQRLFSDVERYFAKLAKGNVSQIKVKKSVGKDVFKTEVRSLNGDDILQVETQFVPAHRGTVLRFIISAQYNVMSMLEAITGRRAHSWKKYPVYCEGYVQKPTETGEVDLFAAFSGTANRCRLSGELIETDLFSGMPLKSGISLAAEGGLEANYPLDYEVFYSKHMKAIDADAIRLGLRQETNAGTQQVS